VNSVVQPFTFDPNTGRPTQFKAAIGTRSMYGNVTWNASGSLYSVAITDPFNSLNNGQCPASTTFPGVLPQ